MKNEETRKQTIEYLDRIKEDYVSNVGNIPSVEPEYFAIVEAIELLSQDPCADAISRQAVDDAIYEYSRSCDVNYAQIMEYIDKLPPVSTEKTGRWKWVQYDFDPRIGNWHCSECRNIVFQGVEKKGINEKSIYKYCPWCGAKMEQPYKGESEDKE